jgi:putative endopeptidase
VRSFPILAALLIASSAHAAAPAIPGSKTAPQYGASGFDATGEDPATKPGDDFFRFANGGWVDRTEIPADKPAYSLRLAITDRTEQRIHDLVEAAAGSAEHEPRTLEGKVGAFYKSFMNEARIESLGSRPLDGEMSAIRAANDRKAIAALMGRADSDYFGSLFGVYTDVDLKDPKRYAVYVTQSGLGLPDRDYYLQPQFASQKAAYQKYVAQLLGLLHWPEPEARARAIVALEDSLAAASWAKAEQRDPVATYNPMTIAALEKFAPGFAWRPYLAGEGFPALDRAIVNEKSAFPKLTAIFSRTPVSTLQAWLAFSVADHAAPYLSKPFADAFFEMRNHTLSGQQRLSERWKRGVRAVSGGDFLVDRYDRFGNLGWAVGQMYTTKYFPPEAKARIEELVANVKAAYHERIEKLDWMSPPTRAEALQKLDTYHIKVGYPDQPRDYSKLVIRDDDIVGNVRRAAAADWAFYVGRAGGPVDLNDWGMTPQTNDAYNGSLRDIVFPAGILQPPVFDPNADPAYNYGAAGGIIGHELTHGFDDQGRKLDAEGKLRDWWAPADAKVFDARASMLRKQYSSYEPLPGVRVNGDLTMGENIADLGGVSLALEAYRMSLSGRPAPMVDGLTGDQRVFLGWAQAWRGKLRDEAIKRQVVSDPHSPRMYRVNGVVRNMDAWYDAFDVKPGNKLYVAPEDRVRIW